MNKLSSLSYGMLLSVTVVLSGCGGGGGSSGSKPPANQPASSAVLSSVASSSIAPSSVASSVLLLPSSSSSSAAASSSAPAITQLTIQGKAVADALAGGEVSFVVGAHTYKVPVNDQGQYQISLSIANEDADQPFTAIATGAASNNWVQMAALYPSIIKLREIAGIDGILNAVEYVGVNISAVTTAEYALVVGNKLAIETDAERKYALLQNTAVDHVAYAAFMQKMLNDIDFDLPKKYKTTLEMFLDYEYTRGQVNILQASGDSFYSLIEEIQNDQQQVRISNKAISGNFLVSSYGFYYLLDLNENGTGHLLTSNIPGGQIWAADSLYRESSFKWVRKGADIKITLDASIDYGKTYGAGSTGFQHCSQPAVNNGLADCSVKMSGMVISLITENEVSKFADISLDVTLVNSTGDIALDLSTVKYRANLLDRSQLYKLKKEELDGFEWFTDRFSYAFNSDGTAIQTNHLTKVKSPINWQLDNGFIKMDGDILMLLPVHTSGPGFTAVRLLAPNNNPLFLDAAFKPSLLIKRESPSMAESAWVGRWNRVSNNSFYSAIDYYSNYGFRDGFETQARGSWKVVSESQVSGLSNGTWRMEHELLAIHDGKHYMQYCYGNDSESFTPSNCLLEAYEIDKTFSGTTFWESWSHPLFQEVDTLKQWKFNGYSELQRQGEFSTRYYQRAASNMLYNRDSGKVLEMLSSDKDSISVCEYDAFDSCDKGTTYNLKRSLELTITAVGNGTVNGIKNSTNSFMFPRQVAHSLFLSPSSGYAITANNIVSDCNGTLNGSYYDIPARDDDCKVAVTFTPIP